MVVYCVKAQTEANGDIWIYTEETSPARPPFVPQLMVNRLGPSARLDVSPWDSPQRRMFNILWLISSCPRQQQTDVAAEFRGESGTAGWMDASHLSAMACPDLTFMLFLRRPRAFCEARRNSEHSCYFKAGIKPTFYLKENVLNRYEKNHTYTPRRTCFIHYSQEFGPAACATWWYEHWKFNKNGLSEVLVLVSL